MHKLKCPKCSYPFYAMGLKKLVGQIFKCHNCGYKYVFTEEMKNKIESKTFFEKAWDAVCGVFVKTRKVNQ